MSEPTQPEHISYIKQSKSAWGRVGEYVPTDEQLLVGCAQRQAKALESIAESLAYFAEPMRLLREDLKMANVSAKWARDDVQELRARVSRRNDEIKRLKARISKLSPKTPNPEPKATPDAP